MYNSEFYNALKKPKFLPKGNVFRAVWVLLYALMAISLFIVLLKESDEVLLAFSSFAVQLGLNILWPFVFFKYKKMDLALILAILLMISVLAMLLIFWDISKFAGILQLPYFIWCWFAIYLNASLIFLNK